MAYTKTALEDRINEMFPQLAEHGIISIISFDDEKTSWAITLVKGKHEFTVYMSKTDADACMDQTYCDDFKKRLYKVVEYLLKSK